MTIFGTWQLRITLESIAILVMFRQYSAIYDLWLLFSLLWPRLVGFSHPCCPPPSPLACKPADRTSPSVFSRSSLSLPATNCQMLLTHLTSLLVNLSCQATEPGVHQTEEESFKIVSSDGYVALSRSSVSNLSESTCEVADFPAVFFTFEALLFLMNCQLTNTKTKNKSQFREQPRPSPRVSSVKICAHRNQWGQIMSDICCHRCIKFRNQRSRKCPFFPSFICVAFVCCWQPFLVRVAFFIIFVIVCEIKVRLVTLYCRDHGQWRRKSYLRLNCLFDIQHKRSDKTSTTIHQNILFDRHVCHKMGKIHLHVLAFLEHKENPARAVDCRQHHLDMLQHVNQVLKWDVRVVKIVQYRQM